jgi:hypothetical protein
MRTAGRRIRASMKAPVGEEARRFGREKGIVSNLFSRKWAREQ